MISTKMEAMRFMLRVEICCDYFFNTIDEHSFVVCQIEIWN